MLTNPSPKSNLKRYPAGGIFQGFGENIPDYLPYYTKGHSGWDILAYLGAPVCAVADGVVVNLGTDPKAGGGLTVRMFHIKEMLYSGYGHLSEILVREGEQVKAGQLIGKMGNTGFIISGGTKFWGNAPAGRGVHLHLTICELEEGWASFTYPINGFYYRVKNLNNGTQGGIDPTPFFTDTIKAEIPDPRIPILQKLAELYRSAIRLLGGEPNN